IEPLFPSDAPIYGSVVKDVPVVSQAATKLENMFLYSIQDVLSKTAINVGNDRLMLFLSTTKGNIDLLGTGNERVQLDAMAAFIQQSLGLKHVPVIVSNACISGVLAIQTAALYIKHGLIDHAIVSGGDLFSKFTLSGFYAFKALSAGICKPFDKYRDGINLGEGVGTVFLTSDPAQAKGLYAVEVAGYGSSNDANHISGPSRDGSGLRWAVQKAMKHTKAEEIDTINAHGTATLYNDNMESLAFQSLGLSDTPLNSLKGYYGHALGAAGVLEMIISIRQMLNNTLVKSLGYKEQGTDGAVNVTKEFIKKEVNTLLKTASGFGGCNSALILKKV
ncbi:MAG TPA: beta-ketoacyl synthase N-terminal-like domain-containing protein, partial [Cytophagaceae bacterium]|nr:beta-ketoacyl synthase N-terminal-like domain-containing protein [Cytophagaceae bacterium]